MLSKYKFFDCGLLRPSLLFKALEIAALHFPISSFHFEHTAQSFSMTPKQSRLLNNRGASLTVDEASIFAFACSLVHGKTPTTLDLS